MSGRLASRSPEHHPRCFLHVPKSGGISVHDALLAALPDASVSLKRFDHLINGFPGLDKVPEWTRERVLLEERDLDAMSRSQLVSGHFFLSTLVRIAPPNSIATVLREPRARLLSLYVFLRVLPDWQQRLSHRAGEAHALRPLDEFLTEPQIAGSTDNVVCRMLLHVDSRIPPVDFISNEHMESVASAAIDWLDQLGFVGVLERGERTWEGLSRFFDATLKPAEHNVTESAGVLPGALPVQKPISERTLDLLSARTAGDALVYRHALMAECTEAEAKQISDVAFAAQLVRLGDIAGKSAEAVQLLTRRVAEADSQIAGLMEQLSTREVEATRLEKELARHRAWLEGIQGSVSWRITSPLRAVKRRVLSARPR